MAVTTTMHSSRRPGDAIASLTNSRRKPCRAGVPGFVKCLRSGAGTLRRRSRQCRYKIRFESPARNSLLLHSRQFVRCEMPFLAFKPHNRQQQVGGTIGGSLKPNKVFFFAGFDQHIFHVPNVVEFLDGSSQVTPQPASCPYTPSDYEATAQYLVFAAAAQLT